VIHKDKKVLVSANIVINCECEQKSCEYVIGSEEIFGQRIKGKE